MYYRKFKDMKISALGIGSLHLPNIEGSPNTIDREAASRVIEAAFEAGINYIDTAHTYHNKDSEAFLGEVLQSYPRDSYYLASKFYVKDNPDLEEVFEEQLQRLGTDYLDFYLLHGIDETSLDLFTDRERNYMGLLEEKKKEGVIKNIGFSFHGTPETMKKLLHRCPSFDMALIQANYVDWRLLEAEGLYNILSEANIPVWVMEPLKGGILADFRGKAGRLLQSRYPESSCVSWAFRFLMGLPNVVTVLSGMASAEQIRENSKLFERPEPLGEEEKKVLEEAVSVFLDEMGVPCSSCRYCCSVCPAELDIPLIIKGYNEKRVSGETWRIAGLSTMERGPSDCTGCGKCAARCPQKIDIPKIMREFEAKQQ
ncbi:MAG TPA: aldo/keto reductase [Candidatus Copromorpha excrementigallinarum]|uniref:Aldo/keto reductase n=1 Tax=Candidatus Allocopromorpha excrementigallinarum TaxID=2840742 RepID=A0A9D1I1T1_9FIRM|nr:aldo/keto reductase [Candidatus Copromorpha excrementigallinarum]